MTPTLRFFVFVLLSGFCLSGCPNRARAPQLNIPASQRKKRPAFSKHQLEQRIHALINAQRQRFRLPALGFDTKLREIARQHSQDMARNAFFEHVNTRGENPTQRGKRQGYVCRRRLGNYIMEGVAENIAQNNLFHSITIIRQGTQERRIYNWSSLDRIARSTVTGWMNSPGHRKNILTRHYQNQGLGVAVAADGKVYITQNFC